MRRATADRRPMVRALIEEWNRCWNSDDLDGLMAVMSADPEYRASTGPGPGTVHRGREAVRAGFAAVMAAEGETPAEEPLPEEEIMVFDNRAVSTWQYTTTAPDGGIAVVLGVDVWTIADDKIAVIDAYRKSFS